MSTEKLEWIEYKPEQWCAGVIVDDDMEVTMDANGCRIVIECGSLFVCLDSSGNIETDKRFAESLVPAFEAFVDAVNAAERKLEVGRE